VVDAIGFGLQRVLDLTCTNMRRQGRTNTAYRVSCWVGDPGIERDSGGLAVQQHASTLSVIGTVIEALLWQQKAETKSPKQKKPRRSV
jgi:hypothetical protein